MMPDMCVILPVVSFSKLSCTYGAFQKTTFRFSSQSGTKNMYVSSWATTTVALQGSLQKIVIISRSLHINFIPFLCSLTEEFDDALISTFEIEASGLLMFQNSKGELLQVPNFPFT